MKETVRAFLQRLLQYTSAKQLRRKYPPLTKKQIEAIAENEEGAISVTQDNFRVDFLHAWKTCLMNKEARCVFIDSYLAAVRGGMFAHPPIDPVLLHKEQVGSILDSHMAYLRRKYREAGKKANPSQQENLAAMARLSARRATVCPLFWSFLDGRLTCL